MRQLSLCLLFALCPLAITAEGNDARSLAAQVLADHAEHHPSAGPALQALARGLREGSISLAEAEQVLRIIALTSGQPTMAAGPAAAPPPAATRPAPRAQRPDEVLGLLDAAPAPANPAASATDETRPEQSPSIADLERWAGARSPDIVVDDDDEDQTDEQTAVVAEEETEELQPRAPQPPVSSATPGLPSDQQDLADIEGRVRLIEKRPVGEREMLMVFVDQGARHGLAEGQRLRVERAGEPVVLLSVFNVRDALAAAIVLEGTWTATSNNEVREGDRVVRDR